MLWAGLKHSIFNFVCSKRGQIGNLIIAVSIAFSVGTIQQFAFGSSIPYGPIYLLLVLTVRAASIALQWAIKHCSRSVEYKHLACLANATLSQPTWENRQAHFQELILAASSFENFSLEELDRLISPRFKPDRRQTLMLHVKKALRAKTNFQPDRPFRDSWESVKLKVKRNQGNHNERRIKRRKK